GLRVPCIGAVAWLTLIGASCLSAQPGATAQLSGTLTDPSGAVVRDQAVSLRRAGTGQIRTTRTTSSGQFVFADVAPGEYRASAEGPGFAPLDLRVELTIGEQAVLHLRFELAQSKQETTVLADAEAIEPARTELSEVVEPRRIENL